MSQPFAASIWFWSSPISAMSASKSASGSPISSPIWLKRLTLAITSPNAISMFCFTVLVSSSGGSCSRMPTE